MSIRVFSSPKEVPPDCYFADCAVSGGTLEAYIKALLNCTGGRLCLRLFPQAVEFPIPCPRGQGVPLAWEECRQLQQTHPHFFSPALMMDYLSYEKSGELRLLLYDTQNSLRKKQQLAERLGVPYLLVSQN